MSGYPSIWALSGAARLNEISTPSLFEYNSNPFDFTVHHMDDSIWIIVSLPGRGKIAFRTAYAPDELRVNNVVKTNENIRIVAGSSIGTFEINIDFPEKNIALLHYTVSIKTHNESCIPFWPKDILVPQLKSIGKIHIKQVGTRSGIILATARKPTIGTFLYLQNLTSLNEYCELTHTSVANTVNGEWPEFGFSLPAPTDNPLPAGKRVTISDAYVLFDEKISETTFDIARTFLEKLAIIYQKIPRPKTEYHNYPSILKKSIHDLTTCNDCWSWVDNRSYMNAYLGDNKTPPEVMVQLAVLLSMLDYSKWSGTTPPCCQDLYGNIKSFYDDELHTIVRWLPTAKEKLDGSEEQKKPDVMDSWYLYHPLLNLSRMALNGDEDAKEIFINSLDYAIKVARHFNYKWPVLYNIKTLKVIKGETQPGEDGEKDVAGIYAHVMLQAWELTGERRFMEEAKSAARSLQQYGFDIFYQANDTAFASGAMLRIYKETNQELYLNLAYLCIANLFKNIALWKCEYGFGKYFPTFFSLFPLNDAPYTAVYEEQECFAALHDFLMHANGVELIPGLKGLLAEFIKYAVHRILYYYPPVLPGSMISEKVKTGKIDRRLWIPIEGIHDGWEKSGSVGQEIYGAGLAFSVVPRHYIRIPNEPFLIFIDYPITKLAVNEHKVTFTIIGEEYFCCRLKIVKEDDKELPDFNVTADEIPIEKTGFIHEYTLKGRQNISIIWKY